MKKNEVKFVSTKIMRRAGAVLFSGAVFALFQIATTPNASAGPILASNLITMAILGGGGVTIGGTGSVITGSIGAYPTTSITGVIPTNFTISGGTVQSGGATAMSAQSELGTAITGLSGLTPTSTVSSLGGLTLAPGVYSSSSTMDLTGTLTLDGGGNANALWVFEVGSALNTAGSSTVNVINTGAGAGVYWVLPTGSGSAVLGSNSTFLGNILANQSISLSTNVTDSCGRLLTQVASVTLAGSDTIGIGNSCSGILAGSNGLSGGGTLTTPPSGGPPVVTPLAPAPVPEPGTVMLLGAGIVFLLARQWRRLIAQCHLVFAPDLCRTAREVVIDGCLPVSTAIRSIRTPDLRESQACFAANRPRNVAPRWFCINRARKPSGIGLIACGV